jgi:hypothetical protein
MTVTRTRTDAGLATALRISVSRLARRLRAQRAASGMTEAVLSETQLAALSAIWWFVRPIRPTGARSS